jgi:hypothetical protein
VPSEGAGLGFALPAIILGLLICTGLLMTAGAASSTRVDGSGVSQPPTLAVASWAILTTNRSSVPEGQSVDLLLKFSGPNCTSGFDNSTVTVQFGDGLNYTEPGSVPQACTGHPGEIELPIYYWYHKEGEFRVGTWIVWASGESLSSNVLLIVVTPPGSAQTALAQQWAIGVTAALLGGVLAALVVRGISRAPPSLPPSEA